MESSHESSERFVDPTLKELLEGISRVLMLRGQLVQPGEAVDGRHYIISGTEVLARHRVKHIEYTPRYDFEGQDFPETLSVEHDDGDIDKWIFLSRDTSTGQIDTQVWLEPSVREEHHIDVEALIERDVTEEDLRRALDRIEFYMAQKADADDLALLRRLLDDLRAG